MGGWVQSPGSASLRVPGSPGNRLGLGREWRENSAYTTVLHLAFSICFQFTCIMLLLVSYLLFKPELLRVCESEIRSVVSDSLQPYGLYSPWNSLGQNTGVGGLSLLQGIFPTQGSNPGLLHCRWILYQLSHKGRMLLIIKLGQLGEIYDGSEQTGMCELTF